MPESSHLQPPVEEVNRRALIVRRRYTPQILLAVGVILLFCVYWIDPAGAGNGYFPPCLLHKYTGFYCAGCGSTRSLHALLNGHFQAAIRYNPMFVILVLPAACWIAADYGLRRLQARPRRRRHPYVALWWGIGTAVVLFTVLRNIPGRTADLLAPPPTTSAPAASIAPATPAHASPG